MNEEKCTYGGLTGEVWSIDPKDLQELWEETGNIVFSVDHLFVPTQQDKKKLLLWSLR